jgi:hypothetical protein
MSRYTVRQIAALAKHAVTGVTGNFPYNTISAELIFRVGLLPDKHKKVIFAM